MAYNKTDWVDDSVPFINAANLNNIESGIKVNTDDIVINTAAIAVNTAKVGITPQQTSDILLNNAKESYTDENLVAQHSLDITANTALINNREGDLGNPAEAGYILSSLTNGIRYWIPDGSVALDIASKYTDELGTNVDTINTSGVYVVDTNLPSALGGSAIMEVVESNDSDLITQEAFDYQRKSVSWFRKSLDSGATWDVWNDEADPATVATTIIDDMVINMVADGHTTGEIVTGLEKSILTSLATIEPTGFDLEDHSYHGIMELCHDASSGMYWRIDENNVYSEITGATTYGDGVTPLADRTFSHRPGASGEIRFWYHGIPTTLTTAQTLLLTNVHTKQIIVYKDNAGTIELDFDDNVHSAISVDAIVAVVTGNPTLQQKVVFANERHGKDMNHATHEMLHSTIGAQYGDGLKVIGLVDNGNTFTEITSGSLWDEDIYHTLDTTTDAPFAYRDANGHWMLETNGSIVSTNELAFTNSGAGDAFYNLDNGDGTWSILDTGADYVAMHIFATNDAEYPIFKVVGQTLYTDRTIARNHLDGAASLLREGELPTPEFLHLYSYIVDGNGNIELGIDGEIYVDYRAGYPSGRYV